MADPLKPILALGVEDRILLVEAIWDSIVADAEGIPVSSAQREEFDRRLAADGKRSESWSSVRARLVADR